MEVPYESIQEYDIRKSYPELSEQQIYLPYLDGTLYTDISPDRAAQEVLRSLAAEGHELCIVTANLMGVAERTLTEYFYEAHNLRCVQYMLQFLREFYPEISQENILIVPRKELVRGDVLIDDNPAHLRSGSFRKILLDKPYNRDFDDDYFAVRRAKDWTEIGALLREMSP